MSTDNQSATEDGSDGPTPDNGVFSMTALANEINQDGEEEDDYFEDIGYNQIVSDYMAAGLNDADLSEEFAQLAAKAEQCKELQQRVKSLVDDLTDAQKLTAAASSRDAEQQKESDEKMEEIRKMEFDANHLTENLIPAREQHIKQLESENEETMKKISLGPGWTEDQERKRIALVDSIDVSHSEVKEQNDRLADLRSQLEIAEKEMEESKKGKDQTHEKLDALKGKIDDAKEQQQAIMLTINEAERTKGFLAEALRVAKLDLGDLKVECEGENKIIHDSQKEVESFIEAQKSLSNQFDALVQNESNIVKELEKLRGENSDIQDEIIQLRKELQTHTKERDRLLKERAKANKMRDLIDAKTAAADKERGDMQKEWDAMNLSTTKLENIDIPMAQKEIETLKRDIRRQEHELELMNRKRSLRKKGSAHIVDLTLSNENMLHNLKMELMGCKKATDKLNEAREILLSEEIWEVERLKQMHAVLQNKQLSLKSLENSNRLLELAVTKAEEKLAEQNSLCDAARKGNNAESKILIGLRDEVHLAKTELLALTSQLKSTRDEIARTDNLVFKEHIHHHDVDVERHSIEIDIANFCDKSEKLHQQRAMNKSVIVQLGHDLDANHKERELLRRKFRNILSDKDVLSARLVAADVEHCKIDEKIQACMIVNKTCEVQYSKRQNELGVAKANTKDLLKEKENLQSQLKHQRDKSEILAALQHDLSKQLDKSAAITVEIGRPINLHRWRHLRDKSPKEFMMLEKIQQLQRSAISTTNKITTMTCKLDKQKKVLSKLRSEAPTASIDELKNRLFDLKSEFHSLNKETKEQDADLQIRIGQTEEINVKILQLEKARMELKGDALARMVFI